MTARGPKPKATVLKLVTNTRRASRANLTEPFPTGRPSPPIAMKGRPAALWRRYIDPAWWLTATDAPKAWLWCGLQAEAEADLARMNAARIGQLRALGSELGLDPASRTRLGGGRSPQEDDPAAEFFQD